MERRFLDLKEESHQTSNPRVTTESGGTLRGHKVLFIWRVGYGERRIVVLCSLSSVINCLGPGVSRVGPSR